MEPMGEHVQPGIAPRDEAAVVPDKAVAVVEGEQVTSHEHFLAPGFAKRCRPDNAAP
jgi:hypothetical protein